MWTARLSHQKSHHTHSEAGCIGLFLNNTVNTVSNLKIGCLSIYILPFSFRQPTLPRAFSVAILDFLLLELENKILPHHILINL
jgi:hypothetical protein